MGLRSQLIAAVFLLGICAGLGWVAYAELRGVDAKQADAQDSAATITRTSVPAKTFQLGRLASLTQIIDRPIFFPDRKRPVPPPPKPAKKPEPKPQKAPGKVVLLGVIISPNERMALVRDPSSRKILHVSVGQAIDAWKLEQIRPDGIVLRWADRVEEVLIDDKAGAPNGSAARARKPPGAAKTAPRKAGAGATQRR